MIQLPGTSKTLHWHYRCLPGISEHRACCTSEQCSSFPRQECLFLRASRQNVTHFVPVWGISDPPFSRRCHWWSRSAEGPEPVPVDQQCAFSPPGLAFFTGAWGSGNPLESVDRASAPGWWTKAVRLTGSAFTLFLPVCDNVPGNWNYM